MFFALSQIMSTMNVEERLEEQEMGNIALKTKVQMLETTNIQHAKNTASLEEKYQIEIASEAENEIVVPIHQMKVLLPSENWYDLLAFVPRRQLAGLVSQIGDRQFAGIIQSFLHGFGKIKLGKMEIIPLQRNFHLVLLQVGLDYMSMIIMYIWPSIVIPPPPVIPFYRPMVKVGRNSATNMPMPDWPMPRNIKDFKKIQLSYLDTSVLNFLGKFQKNSLLTNVNMSFQNFEWDSRTLAEDEAILLWVLTKIVPFITSIDSLKFLGIDLFKMLYNKNNNINNGNSHESQLQWIRKQLMAKTRILMKILYNNKLQLLLEEMMAQTRILVINWHDFGTESPSDKIDWFCSWLYTPRNDGRSRMLRFVHDVNKTTDPAYASLIERIKKDFEDADHPVSFFIYATIRRNNNIEDNSFENDNEKLVIKKANHADEWEKLLIGRYPQEAAKNWIEAEEKEITQWNRKKLNRKINLYKFSMRKIPMSAVIVV